MAFRDKNEKFELEGSFLKKIFSENYNVDHANLSDKKLTFDFAKEMSSDEKVFGIKSTKDENLNKLPKSLAILASGISTKILSENPNEICERLKVLLQEKQAWNISDIIIEEIDAIADKLLEYNCVINEQQKFLLPKSLNW